MSATKTVQTNDGAGDVGARAWLAGGLGWLIPGAGHLLEGRIGRALLMGGSVWVLFVAGVLAKGHLYAPAGAQDIGLLAYFFAFFDLGSGALYIVSSFLGVAVTEQAQFAASGYGDLFLMIAGLLNYLTVLDAFDIAAGRKS